MANVKNENTEQKEEFSLVKTFNPDIHPSFRFDRNLAKNGLSFAKFGADGSLMFDLVVYFANTYQDNFFGFGTLNVDDFCSKMNYKKTNLLKAHKDPHEFYEFGRKKDFEKIKKGLISNGKPNGKDSHNKDDFFYTVLDNALYKLANENLGFRFKVKTDDKDSSGTTTVRIIKTVIKQYKSSSSPNVTDLKKVVYQYSLDNEFVNNLTRWFLNINLFSVHKLRKTNSVYLYSFLKNLQVDLISMNKTSTDSVNFDLLLDLAQISIESPRRAKQQLKIKIENIFTLTDLKGTLTFAKRKENGKEIGYAFQPVITFTNPLSKINSREYITSVSDAATTKYLHELKTTYKTLEIYANENISFSDWFIQINASPVGDESYNKIRAIAKRSYESITNENMSYGDTRITNLMKKAHDIISELKKHKV